MKIQTEYIYIVNEWQAIDADSYDGAEDSNCPVGYGKTEQEAIDDLMEQIEEAKA